MDWRFEWLTYTAIYVSDLTYIAFRGTSISRHHEGVIGGPTDTPQIIPALSYWGVQGRPLIGLPLGRETPVSWTADVIFFSLVSSQNVRQFIVSEYWSNLDVRRYEQFDNVEYKQSSQQKNAIIKYDQLPMHVYKQTYIYQGRRLGVLGGGANAPPKKFFPPPKVSLGGKNKLRNSVFHW